MRPAQALLARQIIGHHKSWGASLALLLSDQLLIFAGFLIAYWLRYHADWPDALEPIVREVETANYVTFTAFLPITLLLIAVLSVLFITRGLYRQPPGTGFLDYVGIIFTSTLIGIALLIVIVFLVWPFFYSRLIFAFAGVTIVALLSAWRALLLRVRHWAWAHGIGQERVLVLGGGRQAQQVMDAICNQPNMGYHLIGYLDQPSAQPPSDAPLAPLLGSLDDLARVVQAHDIHQIILALPQSQHERLLQLVQQCRLLGRDFLIAPELHALSFDRVDLVHVSGVPLLGFKELSLQGWNLAFKRALDLGLIALATPLLVPLCAVLVVLIRLDSAGPALFRQQRIGKHGQPFTCYKFRTMVVDAEARRAELAALNEADGPLFKIRNDPRITRVGRLLRRSSLDELPQLLNVLRGEMSLVGPRPGLPCEVEQYAAWHRRRLEVTPGLTGLWQVLGRSNTTFDEMVRLDIYYAENWSLWLDVRILLQTIPAVLSSKGAY